MLDPVHDHIKTFVLIKINVNTIFENILKNKLDFLLDPDPNSS